MKELELAALRSGIALSTILLASSCNFLSPLDGPGDDNGYIERARACLDQEDYECALENYGQVSDANKDTRESEIALTITKQEGIGFSQIIEAFGEGEGGTGLTKLANDLAGSSDANKRKRLYEAWTHATQVSDNYLRGLSRFVSSVALAAAILSESANADGDSQFSTNDIVENPTDCYDESAADCLNLGTTNCGAPADSQLVSDDSETELLTEDRVQGDPNLNLFHAAIEEVVTALNSEMGADGEWAAGAGLFAEGLGTDFPLSSTESCYRRLLITSHVGE